MYTGGHGYVLPNTGGLSVAESCTDLGKSGFHHPEILPLQQSQPSSASSLRPAGYRQLALTPGAAKATVSFPLSSVLSEH